METGSLPTMSMRILRPILVPSWMEMLGTMPINLDKDFVQDEFIEPCGRSMGATRKCGMMPTDFDDDLIVLRQMSTLPGS